MMTIVGIDPGYDRLGVAVLKRQGDGSEKLIFSTCLTTSRRLNFDERLWQMVDQLKKVIKRHRPSHLALEEIFFTTNRKTAMAVAETRGAIIYLAKELGLVLISLTPSQIKSSLTGYGRADKEQVKRMVKQLLPAAQTLEQDDEIDALAIALVGLQHSRLNYPQVEV